jgi:hypothetical protein
MAVIEVKEANGKDSARLQAPCQPSFCAGVVAYQHTGLRRSAAFAIFDVQHTSSSAEPVKHLKRIEASLSDPVTNPSHRRRGGRCQTDS